MNDVEIQTGGEILFGSLIVPENTDALVLFAHGTGSSRHSPRNHSLRERSIKPDWGHYFLICSHKRRKQPTCTLASIDSTSVCSPNASFTPQDGQSSKAKLAISPSVTSVRVQARRRRWLQRRRFRKKSALWFHAVDVRIWLATHCQKCRRRRCSSLVEMMTL